MNGPRGLILTQGWPGPAFSRRLLVDETAKAEARVRDKSARTALAIATMGLVGLLGTVVLENWGNRLFRWMDLDRLENVERYGLRVVHSGSNREEPGRADVIKPSKPIQATRSGTTRRETKMMIAYSVDNDQLRKVDCSADPSALSEATWIDLLDPTAEQIALAARMLRINILTQKEMRALEVSSQIYRDGPALVMTARVVSRSESDSLRLVTVSFIRIENRLLTLRYGDPSPFNTFSLRVERETRKLVSGEAVMIGLLEAIVDRAAEIFRGVGDDLEGLSNDIFTKNGSYSGSLNQTDLRPILQKVGRSGDLATRVRESLHSLARIVSYLQSNEGGTEADDVPARLDIVDRDIASMLGHETHIMSNVTFLLDATLGLINIQQNAIIKIFSVAAVIFLPPTLIASIYGMNFKLIPELKWEFGYFYALVLMLISAVLPYYYFKRRRWL